MKKRTLKSLNLNKKAISNLEMNTNKGGIPSWTVQIKVSWAVCPTPIDITTRLLGCDE